MLEDISIINVPVLSDADVSAGKSQITGITNDIQLEHVKSYTRTAYTAGTANIQTALFATFALTEGHKVRFLVTHKRLTKEYSTYIQASGDTYTLIAQRVRSRINADPTRIIDSTGGTATITNTQTSASVIDGGVSYVVLTGIVITDSTPYVAPAGTEAVVNALNKGTAASGAQYTTYDITYDLFFNSNKVGGSKIAREVTVSVFAEDTASDYALFNAAIINIFNNTTQDIVKRVSGVASSNTTWSATGVLTALNSTNIVDCTGGNIVLTLPDSATLGDQFLFVRRIDSTGNTLNLTRAGSDTIDGGTTVAISPDRAAWVINDGAGAFWTMPLDETPSSALVTLTDSTGLSGTHDDTIDNIVYNSALTDNSAGAAVDQTIQTIAATTMTVIAAANINTLIDSSTGAADLTVSPIAALTSNDPGALTGTVIAASNTSTLTDSTGGGANTTVVSLVAIADTSMVAVGGSGMTTAQEGEYNVMVGEVNVAMGIANDNYADILVQLALQRTLNAELITDNDAMLVDITDIRTELIALRADWVAGRAILQDNAAEWTTELIAQQAINAEVVIDVAAGIVDLDAHRTVGNNNSAEWAAEFAITRTGTGVIEQNLSDITQKLIEIVAVV